MPQDHNWGVPPKNWAEEQAHRVALEIRRLRGKRSAQWLADRTRELGSPVTRAVISDLEIGRRRYVTTAEVVVLARALDTAPIALLYPYPYYGDEATIQVLPTPDGEQPREVPKIDAVQWFSGVLNISPLTNLGLTMVDQSNYFAQLQGLERARKVFDLSVRSEKLRVQLRDLRARRRDGAAVSDSEIDDLVAEIDDNRARVDDLLSLGDRDLQGEQFEKFWDEHVSKGDGG